MKERKKKQREKRIKRSDMLSTLREREKERLEGTKDRGHDVDVGARRSARSNFDEGQRAAATIEGGWVEKNLRCGFNFQSKRL